MRHPATDRMHVRANRTAWLRRWAGSALALMVLAGGVGGTVAVTAMVYRVQNQHAEALMDDYADNVNRAVTGEVDRYVDTLADVAASVAAQSDFSKGDFTEITSQLNRQRLPGAVGVAFAVTAQAAQVAKVQAQWRAAGAPSLRLVPRGGAFDHAFVVFTRSFDKTPTAVGQDLSQAEEPAEALRRARASGQVIASQTYVLFVDRTLPNDQQQLSFLLAAPVVGGVETPHAYEFRGWILMGMHSADFLDETLQSVSRGAVAVSLVDRSAGLATVVAHTSGSAAGSRHSLRRERTIEVGERTWELRMSATNALLSSTDRHLPWLSVGVGLLLTGLLTALVGILANARNSALAKVDQATAALREDITRRKASEAKLQHLALHDPLTGLANRALLYERIDHALATHRRTGRTLAVLFIDLDGFKQVNDVLGHHAGDQVLIEAANRLRTCARASDTVARLGGDEFAILAEQVTHPDDARTVADHVVRALQSPLTVDGHPTGVTASVGLTIYTPGAEPRSADDILRSADEAMYLAKTAGKDRYLVAADLNR